MPDIDEVAVSDLALRRLVYFVTLADVGNYALAAQRLGVSPSTLWRSVRQLEDDLQVHLVDPRRKGAAPQLTDAGFAVIEPARRLIASGSSLLSVLDLSRGARLPLRLAGYPAHTALVLAKLTATMQAAGHPCRLVRGDEDERRDLGKQLVDDVGRFALDLVVAPPQPHSADLTVKPLYRWKLVAVVDAYPELQSGQDLPIAELARIAPGLIVSPEDHDSYKLLTTAAAKAFVNLNIEATTASVVTMVAEGLEGLTVPVLPADSLAAFPHVKEVRPVVDRAGQALGDTHYVYYRTADSGPVIDEAIKEARRIVETRAMQGVEVVKK